MTTTAKLSQLQRAILTDLERAYLHVEQHGNEHARTNLTVWGVHILHLRGKRGSVEKSSRADSAAFSRALRRLEVRGLVLRNNGSEGVLEGPGKGSSRQSVEQRIGRANYVKLTAEGREVAKRLSLATG